MSIIHSVMWSIHVGFAILWTGSVLFTAVAILPVANRGDIGADALRFLIDRLRWITRIGALAFLLTGGHMAGNLYTVDTLLGSGRGHLVLTMFLLWFVITGLVEVGSTKLTNGLDDGSAMDAAGDASPFLHGAAGLSVLLIITAGLLANPFGF